MSDRIYRVDSPSVPPKDAPPGHTIRYDRWSRQWIWKAPDSSVETPFRSRVDATEAAYAHLRASRDQ